MLFNNRRVSRDSVLIQDMIRDIDGDKLYISPFSEKLLADYGIRLKISDKFLDRAGKNDFCFVENAHLAPYLKEICELTVYRWNRHYPSDFTLDIDPIESGFSLTATAEFVGSSHEKITKEVYTK